jgi:hypothetical protein
MASFFIKTFLHALGALNDLKVFPAGSRQQMQLSRPAFGAGYDCEKCRSQ